MIKHPARYHAVFLSVALLSALIFSAPAFARDISTPYSGGVMRFREIIERKTPEEALGVFVDAWKREDYFTATSMLSIDAARQLDEKVSIPDDLGSLLPKFGRQIGTLMFLGSELQFYMLDPMFPADQMLRLASRINALPFAFGRQASFEEIRKVSTGEIVFEVETDAAPERLFVTMISNKGGFWKVDQIVFEGSSTSKKPWGFSDKSQSEK